ncbi:hypothetical protein [Roseovarius amoyensis]|uniref:hypothetical protein n=1 Tax=Roseovarius amoyensis TaxID=2211448 RepID=UPI000DBE1289|nr:hypothetical protein [Roseovarius amoyensis]
MATVASTPRFTASTLGSDTAGPFNVGFRLFESDALTVYVNGEKREDWTLTADLDSGHDDAATITFDASLSNGDILWIEGSMVPERETDYGPTEPRLTDKANAELARVWATLVETVGKAANSLRTTTAQPPVDFEDGAVPMFKDGVFQNGPTADEVEMAQGYAAVAQAARDKAALWAEAAEDVEVESGQYSALHHAAKAATSASSASVSADRAELYASARVDTFADLSDIIPTDLAVGELVTVTDTGMVVKRVTSGGDYDYTGSGGVIFEVMIASVADAAEAAETAQEAAETAQDGAEAALQAIVNETFDLGLAWFVDPTVTGATAGSGSISDPFSPEHAFTGGSGVILPGHTVYLRGGTYKPSAHSLAGGRWDGFRVGSATFGGEPGNPVTFTDYPGEKAVFDDPLTWASLTNPIAESGRNVYETNTLTGLSGQWVGGSYRVDGKWYPLGSYRVDNTSKFQATTSIYADSGDYYTGPAVCALSTGEVRIRLDPPYIATENPFFSGDEYGDDPVHPVSLDPDAADLALFRQGQICLNIDGDWIDWVGTQIDGFYTLIKLNGDYCRILDLKSNRCPYIGIYPVGNNWTIGGDHFDIDGNLHETGTNIAWGDIKNGDEVLVQNRCQAIPIADIDGGGRICGKFKIRNFFDGHVIFRPDIEIGGPVDKTLVEGLTGQARENAMWAHAGQYLNIWDDAFQIGHRSQRLHIHHIICKGAGPSRVGTGSTTDYGSDFPNIHHCIFDTNSTRVMLNRRGRNSTRVPPIPEPDETGFDLVTKNEAGRLHRPVISTHGANSGPSDWLFPWAFTNNTLISGDDTNVPMFYKNIASFNSPAGLSHGVLNKVFNNLIIDSGIRITNPISNNLSYVNLKRIDTTIPTDIFDGNAWIYEEDPPLRFQKLTTSAGDMDNQITLCSELQTGAILTDVQVYYPPGWEADGIDKQGAITDVIDPMTYRPIDPDIKTGAVDLTMTGIEGLEYYSAYRGALAPLDSL